MNDSDIVSSPLPDLESILFGITIDKIEKQESEEKIMDLEFLDLRANLYSMVVFESSFNIMLVKKAPSNDRFKRNRPFGLMDDSAIILGNTQDQGAFAEAFGQYGKAWGKEYKYDDEYAMPSINEIMEGLMLWLTVQLESRMAQKSKNKMKKIINSYKKSF